MTSIHINGIESIDIVRQDNEDADLLLTLEGEDGTTITANLGRSLDDAIEIRDLFLAVAKQVTDDIIAGWHDVPDEFDAFVSEDRGGYYVQSDGVSIESGGRGKAFPSREVAEYELAKLMVEQGCFPNCWYVNDRGNTENIHAEIRKYHDEGGTDMLPLAGIEYRAGDDITVTVRVQKSPSEWELIDVSGEVIEDYGVLGIIYTASGDDDPQFTDDRSTVKAWEESDEDESEDMGSSLIYTDSYGQVSVEQHAAYRECNISPSDHDDLVDKFGASNREAIIAAVRRRHAKTLG